MKILVVHSGNHAQVAPFIAEQANSLREAGCDVRMHAVSGRGLWGYLKGLSPLKRVIADFQPDIVHAHYGLCGLLCTLQHNVPVVVTYHGSDINDKTARPFSHLAMRRASHNIFVCKKLLGITKSQFSIFNFQFSVIPCGVDTSLFHPMQREEACRVVGLDPSKHYILFAGAFNNEVKNPQLAKETCALLPDVTLLELKDYTRAQVAALMNAVDALLMTSLSEGSPQVVKEALACNCPVVSVDVGDVRERTEGVEGCFVSTTRSAKELAKLLNHAILSKSRTTGRERILSDELDNQQVAKRLMDIYNNLLQSD
jgi:glycosyltransferase involved in cell wall biosynthesis